MEYTAGRTEGGGHDGEIRQEAKTIDKIIEIKINGSHLTRDSQTAGVQGEANAAAVRIEFDPGWDGLAKTITWWNARGGNEVKRILTADLLEDVTAGGRIYLAAIPGEAMTEAGKCRFAIDGYVTGQRRRSVYGELVVLPGSAGADGIDPTPTQAEQLQVQIDALQEQLREGLSAALEAEESAASASADAATAARQRAGAEESSAAAAASEQKAAKDALAARSYAEGGTGTREGEDHHNARYYMEQAQKMAGGEFLTEGLLEQRLDTLTPGEIGAASAADNRVRTYTALSDIGLTNADMDAADFQGNLVRILRALPSRSELWMYTSGSTVPNLQASVTAALTADLGLPSLTMLDCRFERIGSVTLLARVTPQNYNTTALWHAKEFACVLRCSEGSEGSRTPFVLSRDPGGFYGPNHKPLPAALGAAAADHTHAASEIVSGTVAESRLPTMSVSKGGTGRGSLTAGKYLVGNGTGAVALKAAAEVLTHIGAAAADHGHTAEAVGALPIVDAPAAGGDTNDMDKVLTSGAHLALYRTDGTTAGTPAKAGLTTMSYATILSFAISATRGCQLALVSGSNLVCVRRLYGSTPGPWGALYTENNRPTAEALGAARVQSGSYAGTGLGGAANPTAVTLPFEPKLLIVTPVRRLEISHSDEDPMLHCIVWSKGLTESLGASVGGVRYSRIYAQSGTTVSWYIENIEESGDTQQVNQLNAAGSTYHYVAMG